MLTQVLTQTKQTKIVKLFSIENRLANITTYFEKRKFNLRWCFATKFSAIVQGSRRLRGVRL